MPSLMDWLHVASAEKQQTNEHPGYSGSYVGTSDRHAGVLV